MKTLKNLFFALPIICTLLAIQAPVWALTVPPECIPESEPMIEFIGTVAHFNAGISTECTPHDQAYFNGNPANDYELTYVLVELLRRPIDPYLHHLLEGVESNVWANGTEIMDAWSTNPYYDFTQSVNIAGYGPQYEYSVYVAFYWGEVPFNAEGNYDNTAFQSQWIPGPVVVSPQFDNIPDGYIPEGRDEDLPSGKFKQTEELQTKSSK